MPRLIPNKSVNITKTREYWLAHLEAHENSGLKPCQYADSLLSVSKVALELANLV